MTVVATKRKRSVSITNQFDLLAEGDKREIIALMLWKSRHSNPDMTITIDAKDVAGLADCLAYLKLSKDVRIWRPPEIPATPPIPAMGRRPAIPGRPAIPARDVVIVQMVDEEGNAIIPVENNEQDFDAAAKAKTLARLRETVPDLANSVRNAAARGEFSGSMICDLAVAALALVGR